MLRNRNYILKIKIASKFFNDKKNCNFCNFSEKNTTDSEKISKILDRTDEQEPEAFEPNILNSTVYIISMALQVSTFAVNYRV